MMQAFLGGRAAKVPNSKLQAPEKLQISRFKREACQKGRGGYVKHAAGRALLGGAQARAPGWFWALARLEVNSTRKRRCADFTRGRCREGGVMCESNLGLGRGERGC